ncbi:MAG: hypothetical protein NUV81_03030 [bacterium]|nr:hypothetical protein [bacterium]
MNSLNKTTNLVFGYATLLLIMLLGSGTLVYAQHTLRSNQAKATEDARPARISLTVLSAHDCETCSPTESIVNEIYGHATDVMEQIDVAYDSDEGKDLITQYAVTRIPAIIITGEIDKQNIQPFFAETTTRVRDANVWSNIGPVYLQPATGDVMGRVSLTLLTDSSCSNCYDPVQIKNILTNSYGVQLKDEKTIDIKSADGKELVKRYSITSVPTVILSPEINNYLQLISVWDGVGSVEPDGAYVFRNMSQLGQIIYHDLGTGQIIDPTIAQ